MKQYIIDRIETETVCLEDESKATIRIAKKELPAEIKEGQVLFYDADGWRIDAEKRIERRMEVKQKLDELFGKRNRK